MNRQSEKAAREFNVVEDEVDNDEEVQDLKAANDKVRLGGLHFTALFS